MPAFEMNDFAPLSLSSPPESVTVVVIPLRSEPATGSVRASAAKVSHLATLGSHSRFCSSVPARAIA